jgi:Leucine-rich repeat (LRR) protein
MGRQVPKALEGLARLRSLSLQGNRLTTLPPSLARFSTLKQLDLSGNLLGARALSLIPSLSLIPHLSLSLSLSLSCIVLRRALRRPCRPQRPSRASLWAW